MITSAHNEAVVTTPHRTLAVQIIGVGGAGITLVELMRQGEPSGADFAVVDTDARSLAVSGARKKVHLEIPHPRGLGAGNDPDRGRALAEEQFSKLKALFTGADMVFVLAGLGGGAGTGIGPVVARAAKEAGALTLGFVAMPFDCEGRHRQRLALQGLTQFKAAADGAICLPNQKLCKLIDENTSVLETFKIINEFLVTGVFGVWRLLRHRGVIEIPFAELTALLQDRHTECALAIAEAMGPTRSREVMDKLLAHPLLDGGQVLVEAETVWVNLTGGPDLSMADINRVMGQINEQCERAQVIMGATVDETFKDRLAITLVAARKHPECDAWTKTAPNFGEPDQPRLSPLTGERSGSRFASVAPVLTPEQVAQLPARQGSGALRQRKSASRMRQAQLPLEIVSKGRFDKSEPTVHKGEDLDVPTYIRQGVPLN
ncbi:MAG TPA: hypothetical protein PK202_08130 [Verrucomicrobiota bacterium]|nr:hypothetical protein [Verrucomicrobiota bacterium]HPO43037.1 hypothetical protein [Verrucomicrobiota bacterium]